MQRTRWAARLGGQAEASREAAQLSVHYACVGVHRAAALRQLLLPAGKLCHVVRR